MNINRVLSETFVIEAEHHAELGSTNDRCAELAKRGAQKLPLLVTADRQTAGRGRGRNLWWTGPNSLAFSLLLQPLAPQSESNEMLGRHLKCSPNISLTPLLSLAAGLAVVDAVKPRLKNQDIGLHWPNDVIAAGHKLSGILVEVLADGRIIIGIGINTNDPIADAPQELRSIATSLLDLTGANHDHTEILVSLLKGLEKHLADLKREPSQVTLRADALCLQRNRPLTLQQGAETVNGVCRGIAPDGALLLESRGDLRSYYSGVICT
jgi:BirA family biotin operon repressor/biotin-[acetyl-CoA-carboxylase] ligase